jgi:hypothetical protein
MSAARCRECSWLSSHIPPRRRAAQAAIANGSRECAPDDKLRALRRFVKEMADYLLIRPSLTGLSYPARPALSRKFSIQFLNSA